MIKKLSGGSGSICRVIDNKYVIKSAHTDQARKKIKQQIAFLQANPKTVYPEIIDSGNDWYTMPYYKNQWKPKIKANEIKALRTADYLFRCQVPIHHGRVQGFDFNYYTAKIIPLLKSGDIVFPHHLIHAGFFRDFDTTEFHGDLTLENIDIIEPDGNLMFYDPNPSGEWETWGLEVSKFLCSAYYGYEWLRDNKMEEFEPFTDPTFFSTDRKVLNSLKFYAACHFMRITPYNGREIWRQKYNEIMLDLLDDIFPHTPRIYDFDGVLVHTKSANELAFKKAGDEIGIVTGKFDYNSGFGYGYKEAIPMMFGKELTDQQIEDIHIAKRHLYLSEDILPFTKPINYMVNNYLKWFVEGKSHIMTLASKECATAVLDFHEIPYNSIGFLASKTDKIAFSSTIQDETAQHEGFPRMRKRSLLPIVFEDDPECIKLLKEDPNFILIEVKK
jgi:hypothetical protein